jgi:hypothetical protein
MRTGNWPGVAEAEIGKDVDIMGRGNQSRSLERRLMIGEKHVEEQILFLSTRCITRTCILY